MSDNGAEQIIERLESELKDARYIIQRYKEQAGVRRCEQGHAWLRNESAECPFCRLGAESRRARIAEYRLRRVIGWRENDWPEGFDRRTAEMVAELASPESIPETELEDEPDEWPPACNRRLDNSGPYLYCGMPPGHTGPCGTVASTHPSPGVETQGHPLYTRCADTTDGGHEWERWTNPDTGETGMVCKVCGDGYPTLSV